MRRFVLALLFLCITGCALITKVQQMPAKKQALWVLRAYNAEYIDVQHKARMYRFMPPEGQKILRFRVMMLRELFPVVKKYMGLIQNGEEPPRELVQRVLKGLERLMECDPEDVEKNAPPPEDVQVEEPVDETA
jgi:hypothetical protein